ncbi:hypothetical protein AAHB43_00045 [Staphylococcus pseudintermedius]
MIKIYKNENDELECHVNYAGYDFKFQCIKNGSGATFEGAIQQSIENSKVISMKMVKYWIIYKM